MANKLGYLIKNLCNFFYLYFRLKLSNYLTSSMYFSYHIKCKKLSTLLLQDNKYHSTQEIEVNEHDKMWFVLVNY